MKEHNNRKIAKTFAEYITGQELRKYVAQKVKKYVGDNPVVFDGAIGSGQLEQYVNPKKIYGVEIQEESCKALKENFKNVDIENKSFFNYDREDVLADCIIMNPPFSIEYKSLTIEEQENIKREFGWKKNGKVDDIFILKSLKYTKRFGFYIAFPGISYRKTEEIFRKEIGNNLLELNMIENAFEDTNISVIFLVIDKEKHTSEIKKEIYNCKTKEIIYEEKVDIDDVLEKWRIPHKQEEQEQINIDEINEEINNTFLKNLKNHLEKNIMLKKYFNAKVEPIRIIGEIRKICNEYENDITREVKQ